MSILGIHHVGIVSGDAERTIDYYTRVLGLDLLSHDPDDARHPIVFGRAGVAGAMLSAAVRPGAEPGHEGVGGTHHFALLVETRDGLLRWKRWLTDRDIPVNGPLDRHYFESIYHRDPDGQVIEIATRGAGWTRDEEPDRIGTEHRPPPEAMLKGNAERERIRAETWPEPVAEIGPEMRFGTLHHVTVIGDDIERTHAFVNGVLGLRRVKRTSNFDMPDSFHWYWGVDGGQPGTVVTYFERRGAAPVRPGPGQVDHYALGVADRAALEGVAGRLAAAGCAVSAIHEGAFFDSVMTLDPHGHTVEIATTARFGS